MFVLRKSIGRPKHVRVMAGAVEGDKFIGKKAQELRGLLKIQYPMRNGVVENWDDMERLWQHLYTEELKTSSEDVNNLFCVINTQASCSPDRSTTKSQIK